jgi:hypothetical protein
VDEKEYKEVYHSVNSLKCAFEKATLTRRFACEKYIRINIAEREATSCSDPAAQEQCKQLLNLLHENSSFALQMPHSSSSLPHAKEIKVQCGGLQGLQLCLQGPGENTVIVENIHGLINNAISTYGKLENLPFNEIVKSIASFEGRKRRRKN